MRRSHLQGPPPDIRGKPAQAELARALQEATDDRALRWALGVAILVHLLLFALHPPARSEPPPEPETAQVFTVHTPRFKTPPPEPPPPAEKPPQQIPIPAPTLEDPEPIRELIPEAPPLEPPEVLHFHFPAPPPPPPAPPTGPVELTSEMARPEKLHAPAPAYTEAARRVRVQGIVVVRAVIDEEGWVRDVAVVQGLPMGLDQATVDAIRQWRFAPATLHGRPVSVYYHLTVRFRIE